jgi:hypothetical protein
MSDNFFYDLPRRLEDHEERREMRNHRPLEAVGSYATKFAAGETQMEEMKEREKILYSLKYLKLRVLRVLRGDIV